MEEPEAPAESIGSAVGDITERHSRGIRRNLHAGDRQHGTHQNHQETLHEILHWNRQARRLPSNAFNSKFTRAKRTLTRKSSGFRALYSDSSPISQAQSVQRLSRQTARNATARR